MKVLISSGCTREPIDNVRFITNLSSGATGSAIATYFTQQGAEVTYLHAQGASPADANKDIEFGSFDSLMRKLFFELDTGAYDFVIHAAAVSDYRVKEIHAGPEKEVIQKGKKISSGQNLFLELEPTPKLVHQIKARSPKTKVIAFKLTDTASASEKMEAIMRLFYKDDVDFVVQNDLSEITKDNHVFTILEPGGRLVQKAESKSALAEALYSLCKEFQ